MFFAGCATVGKKTAGEEKLIWSSHEKRPDWLKTEPYKDGKDLFFVGMSEKLALEKDARDIALRDAINNVVGYIGTDVTSRFQKIQTSYGLSSDIMDPTISTKQFEEQFSKAIARRVKAKEWYIEKYRQNDEIFFVVSVIAFVPREEVDKSIDEQIKQREETAKFVKVFGTVLKNNNFNIKLWTDKEADAVYTEGEKMKIYFKTDRDSYVYLFHKNGENDITQLFPNSYIADNFVRANQEYSMPDENMKFQFTVKSPFGSEIIKAVASLERQKELELMAEREIFPQLGKIDDGKVHDVVRIISSIPENSRAEDIAIIRTVEK